MSAKLTREPTTREARKRRANKRPRVDCCEEFGVIAGERGENCQLSVTVPPYGGSSMMKALAVVLLAVAFPALLVADTLSDLRKRLETFPAKAPFSASANVEVNAATQDDASRGGRGAFDVESGPAGFVIRISPKTLAASGNEAAAQKQNPNSPTPTRTAMVALTVFDVMDSVDAASMLRGDLNSATLIEERSAAIDGRPSTLLRIKVKPSFATRSRFVSEPKIELKIYVGSDGVPIAAERVSNFAAGVAFVKGENTRTERWEFAVHGDRLYATRYDQSEDATAAGKHLKSSRTVTYARK